MRLALGFVLLAFASTTSAEGWVCVTDSATGFRYDGTSKEWVPQTFQANSKYVIKPWKPESSVRVHGQWKVLEVGGNFPIGSCTPLGDQWMNCDLVFRGTLRIRTDRLMFWSVLPGQYIDSAEILAKPPPGADRPDDMVLEIGRCTPL